MINKVLSENPQITEEIKTLIEKVVNSDSVNIFHKPKDEGVYNYKPIFADIESSGFYVAAKPEMASISVSQKAKEYSLKLFSSAQGNFDKTSLAIFGAILEPEK